MSDFTEEQEAEIQKRIKNAKQEEQYKIAVAQAYRISLQNLATLVDQFDPKTKQMVKSGPFDPFVYLAFQNEFNKFLEENFKDGQQPPKEETVKKDGE
ncbi:MAG: hypothetical protein PHX61_02305 [Alphaproteobacteria bacterium]|nr:hypothetical protein [Alphaproteobacteria bacterium]